MKTRAISSDHALFKGEQLIQFISNSNSNSNSNSKLSDLSRSLNESNINSDELSPEGRVRRARRIRKKKQIEELNARRKLDLNGKSNSNGRDGIKSNTGLSTVTNLNTTNSNLRVGTFSHGLNKDVKQEDLPRLIQLEAKASRASHKSSSPTLRGSRAKVAKSVTPSPYDHSPYRVDQKRRGRDRAKKPNSNYSPNLNISSRTPSPKLDTNSNGRKQQAQSSSSVPRAAFRANNNLAPSGYTKSPRQGLIKEHVTNQSQGFSNNKIGSSSTVTSGPYARPNTSTNSREPGPQNGLSSSTSDAPGPHSNSHSTAAANFNPVPSHSISKNSNSSKGTTVTTYSKLSNSLYTSPHFGQADSVRSFEPGPENFLHSNLQTNSSVIEALQPQPSVKSTSCYENVINENGNGNTITSNTNVTTNQDAGPGSQSQIPSGLISSEWAHFKNKASHTGPFPPLSDSASVFTVNSNSRSQAPPSGSLTRATAASSGKKQQKFEGDARDMKNQNGSTKGPRAGSDRGPGSRVDNDRSRGGPDNDNLSKTLTGTNLRSHSARTVNNYTNSTSKTGPAAAAAEGESNMSSISVPKPSVASTVTSSNFKKQSSRKQSQDAEVGPKSSNSKDTVGSSIDKASASAGEISSLTLRKGPKQSPRLDKTVNKPIDIEVNLQKAKAKRKVQKAQDIEIQSTNSSKLSLRRGRTRSREPGPGPVSTKSSKESQSQSESPNKTSKRGTSYTKMKLKKNDNRSPSVASSVSKSSRTSSIRTSRSLASRSSGTVSPGPARRLPNSEKRAASHKKEKKILIPVSPSIEEVTVKALKGVVRANPELPLNRREKKNKEKSNNINHNISTVSTNRRSKTGTSSNYDNESDDQNSSPARDNRRDPRFHVKGSRRGRKNNFESLRAVTEQGESSEITNSQSYISSEPISKSSKRSNYGESHSKKKRKREDRKTLSPRREKKSKFKNHINSEVTENLSHINRSQFEAESYANNSSNLVYHPGPRARIPDEPPNNYSNFHPGGAGAGYSGPSNFSNAAPTALLTPMLPQATQNEYNLTGPMNVPTLVPHSVPGPGSGPGRLNSMPQSQILNHYQGGNMQMHQQFQQNQLHQSTAPTFSNALYYTDISNQERANSVFVAPPGRCTSVASSSQCAPSAITPIHESQSQNNLHGNQNYCQIYGISPIQNSSGVAVSSASTGTGAVTTNLPGQLMANSNYAITAASLQPPPGIKMPPVPPVGDESGLLASIYPALANKAALVKNSKTKANKKLNQITSSSNNYTAAAAPTVSESDTNLTLKLTPQDINAMFKDSNLETDKFSNQMSQNRQTHIDSPNKNFSTNSKWQLRSPRGDRVDLPASAEEIRRLIGALEARGLTAPNELWTLVSPRVKKVKEDLDSENPNPVQLTREHLTALWEAAKNWEGTNRSRSFSNNSDRTSRNANLMNASFESNGKSMREVTTSQRRRNELQMEKERLDRLLENPQVVRRVEQGNSQRSRRLGGDTSSD